jgi:integrase/recombinase XerD
MEKYNIYSRDLPREFKKLKDCKNISKTNRSTIKNFINNYCLDGNNYNNSKTGDQQAIKLIRFLRLISNKKGPYKTTKRKDLTNLSKKDTQDLIKEFSNLTVETRNTYKKCLRSFCIWVELEKFNKKQKDPNELRTYREFVEEGKPRNISWITIEKKPNKKLTEKEMLTAEDILKMINSAGTTQEKLLVALWYDAGVRIGELLTIQLKDINQDLETIRVFGKMGERIISCKCAKPYLRNWLNQYPFEKLEDNYLFISTKSGKPKTYTCWQRILKNIQKRTNITKNIHFHLARKSRATELAKNGLAVPIIKSQFGWSQNSRVLEAYIHTTNEDFSNAFSNATGGKIEKIDTLRILLPKFCDDCGYENPATEIVCQQCFNKLKDVEIKTEMGRILKENDELKKRIKILERNVCSDDQRRMG